MTQVRRFNALRLAAFLLIFSLTAAAQFGFPKKGNKGEAASPGASDQPMLIQNQLLSQINLTKTTADRSDIITAGDVLVLQKDGLMMCSTASSYAYSNTYNNGVLTANQKNRTKDAAISATKNAVLGHFGLGGGGSPTDAANNACASRQFVAGEKFWLTGIVAQKDGILITTYSDPYPDPSGNQVRYYGEIKFAFPKGSVPSVDDFVKTITEVINFQQAEGQGNQNNQGDQGNQGNQGDQGVQPAGVSGEYFLKQTGAHLLLQSDGNFTLIARNKNRSTGQYTVNEDTLTLTYNTTGRTASFKIQGDTLLANSGMAWVRTGDAQGADAPPAQTDAPPPAPPQDIAPPAPLAETPPPTIVRGQTKDEVTAVFGQPTRIAKLGAKEVFYYKDMKVTFTNGKVSKIE